MEIYYRSDLIRTSIRLFSVYCDCLLDCREISFSGLISYDWVGTVWALIWFGFIDGVKEHFAEELFISAEYWYLINEFYSLCLSLWFWNSLLFWSKPLLTLEILWLFWSYLVDWLIWLIWLDYDIWLRLDLWFRTESKLLFWIKTSDGYFRVFSLRDEHSESILTLL